MDSKESFSSWKLYLILFGLLVVFGIVYYQMVRATDMPVQESAVSTEEKYR